MQFNWLEGFNKWLETAENPSLQDAFQEGMAQAFEAISGQARVAS